MRHKTASTPGTVLLRHLTDLVRGPQTLKRRDTLERGRIIIFKSLSRLISRLKQVCLGCLLFLLLRVSFPSQSNLVIPRSSRYQRLNFKLCFRVLSRLFLGVQVVVVSLDQWSRHTICCSLVYFYLLVSWRLASTTSVRRKSVVI